MNCCPTCGGRLPVWWTASAYCSTGCQEEGRNAGARPEPPRCSYVPRCPGADPSANYEPEEYDVVGRL